MSTTDARLAGLADRLKKNGWRKRAGLTFTYEIRKNWLGIVGINCATRARGVGEILLHPIIGVRSQELEKLVAECKDEKFHQYSPSSVSTPLIYLVPENLRHDWLVERSNENAEQVFDEVIEALETYGEPQLEKMANFEYLAAVYERQYENDTRITYRWPAIHLIMGNVPGALEAITDVERYLLQYEGKPFTYEVRDYLERLKEMVVRESD